MHSYKIFIFMENKIFIYFMNLVTYEINKIIFSYYFIIYIILKFKIFIWKLESMIMILGFSLWI